MSSRQNFDSSFWFSQPLQKKTLPSVPDPSKDAALHSSIMNQYFSGQYTGSGIRKDTSIEILPYPPRTPDVVTAPGFFLHGSQSVRRYPVAGVHGGCKAELRVVRPDFLETRDVTCLATQHRISESM